MFGVPLYWRETHKQPKLLIFDGRLVVVLMAVIMHIRLWTVLLALIVMIVLFLFDRKGIPADSILRFLRAGIVGRRRTARGRAAERMPADFGFETAPMVRREALNQEAILKNRTEAMKKAQAKAKAARSRKHG